MNYKLKSEQALGAPDTPRTEQKLFGFKEQVSNLHTHRVMQLPSVEMRLQTVGGQQNVEVPLQSDNQEVVMQTLDLHFEKKSEADKEGLVQGGLASIEDRLAGDGGDSFGQIGSRESAQARGGRKEEGDAGRGGAAGKEGVYQEPQGARDGFGGPYRGTRGYPARYAPEGGKRAGFGGGYRYNTLAESAGPVKDTEEEEEEASERHSERRTESEYPSEKEPPRKLFFLESQRAAPELKTDALGQFFVDRKAEREAVKSTAVSRNCGQGSNAFGSGRLPQRPEPVRRRFFHTQSKSVSGLETTEYLSKFRKKTREAPPAQSERGINAFGTQSVRNAQPGWTSNREVPYAQSHYNAGRLPVRAVAEKRAASRREWERERHWDAQLQRRVEPKPGAMSKSVGLLPRVSRQSSRVKQVPEGSQTQPWRPGNTQAKMNRSMTGLEARNSQRPPVRRAMHRKFSEIPRAAKWAHRTMDLNHQAGHINLGHLTGPLGPKQSTKQLGREQSNTLSFKKEQETEGAPANAPAHEPTRALRTVQSNLSVARVQRELGGGGPPMSYSQVRQRRKSEEAQLPLSFSQVHANPSQMNLLNTSQSIAPSVYMNPEPRSFSEEDLEHRLTLLFRKMLVFSSKIDTLKEKIMQNNPNFSSYKLFARFSGDRRTHMGLAGLAEFFRVFNFDFGARSVEKFLIFLSKYQLDARSSFAEGTGDEEVPEAVLDALRGGDPG